MRLTGQQIQDAARAYYKRRVYSGGPNRSLQTEWHQVNAYWSWIWAWFDYGHEIGKARQMAEKR